MLGAAVKGLCPRCGAKTLFDGWAKFADKCCACGLDYTAFNVGDGPAAFLTMGVGAVIIVLALLLDSAVRPPFWLHVIVWVPVTAALTVWSLRVAKAALLAAEYRNGAGEARKP